MRYGKGEVMRAFQMPPDLNQIHKKAFSPDGNLLAYALIGGTITLWDTEKGKEKHTFKDTKTSTKLRSNL